MSTIPISRAFHATSLLAILSVPLLAQGSTYIAYPQDTSTGGWGNLGPLGYNATLREARTHMLIPAAFLPSAGGAIVGIEVVAANFSTAFTVTYSTLNVAMDHLVSPTPFPALSTTFAANLTAPVQVLSLVNQTITYPPGAWHRFSLQQPFAYNGRDHLVIEFVKVTPPGVPGNLYMVTSRDERLDIPRLEQALGASGSGAPTSPVATATGIERPLRMRVIFAGTTPTTVVSSPMVGGTYFGIGTSIGVDTHAAPGFPVLQGLDLNNVGLQFRTPWAVPFILGTGWVIPGPLLGISSSGIVPAGGVHSSPLAVPFNPGLIGLTLVFQSVVFDPALGLVWSSATDATIR